MIIIDSKPDGLKPVEDNLQNTGGDLPPAYDALSIHRPQHNEDPYASFAAFPGPVAGSSRDPFARVESSAHQVHPPVLNINKLLPAPPPPSTNDSTTSLRSESTPRLRRPHARKHTSWLSLLPFASTFSAKRVRQSVLSIVSDLVVSRSHAGIKERRNVHEILSSVAETCSEHKLSLSSLLQEAFIADHTPIYWAVVNYREELLVALLFHTRPLTTETISDVRRACLVGSNQALFHALRVCGPPFHMTDGIQIPSLRTASENLLLGYRPLDYVRIQQSNDQGFVVSFDIVFWQSRMKALGWVSVEFIVCGRMWSVTFFSAYPSSPIEANSGKAKKGKDSWYVMVSILESSPPTFLDSRLTVEVPSPSIRKTTQMAPKPREVRSMTFTSVREKQHPNRSSMYDYGDNGIAHERTFPSEAEGNTSVTSSYLPPPSHPLRGSLPSSRLSFAPLTPLSVHLQAGNRKLGRRTKSGEPLKTPSAKPETWSDHGVGYTSAAVCPLQEDHMSLLLCENSPYLLPDGTLIGRLEARLAKPESSKDCVIC